MLTYISSGIKRNQIDFNHIYLTFSYFTDSRHRGITFRHDIELRLQIIFRKNDKT